MSQACEHQDFDPRHHTGCLCPCPRCTPSLLERALLWADMRRDIRAMLDEVRAWRKELEEPTL